MLPDFLATHKMRPFGVALMLVGGDNNCEVLINSCDGGSMLGTLSAQTKVLQPKMLKPKHHPAVCVFIALSCVVQYKTMTALFYAPRFFGNEDDARCKIRAHGYKAV